MWEFVRVLVECLWGHSKPAQTETGRSRSEPDKSRSQTVVLGFALLFAVTVVAVSAVVVLGSGALEATKTEVDIERAEKVMTQFDATSATVALGDSTTQQMDLPRTGEGTYRVDESAGRINITVYPASGSNTTLVNQSLGEFRYETGPTTIGYQGGGVWRQTGNGSTMVSPPEFHYRGTTLTLPLITVEDTGAVTSPASVSRTQSGVRKFPAGGLDNPLENARIEIAVTSEYYQAWGRFFEDRTDGIVETHHVNETAVLALETPVQSGQSGELQPEGAIISGASKNILIDNKGCIDSYKSPDYIGDHHECDNNNGNGKVIAAGGLKLDTNSEVRGNVLSGDTVNLVSDEKMVHGDVKCAEGNDDCKSGSGDAEGTQNVNKSVLSPSPIDDEVEAKIDEIESVNDNANATDISGNATDSGTVELTEGRYYLDKMDRDANVTLNTTGGDITLAIDGPFDLGENNGPAIVTVRGEHRVIIYLADGGGNSEMNLDNGAKVITVDDSGNRVYNSTRVLLKSPSGLDADIDSGSEFTGLIYAPEDEGTTAGAVNMAGGVVFGAVVAHVDGMDENNDPAAIHYDERLSEMGTQQQAQIATNDATVTNVHLTVNRINVTG